MNLGFCHVVSGSVCEGLPISNTTHNSNFVYVQQCTRFCILITMKKEVRPKTIAFDFDGVIAKYNGFISHDDVQEPISEVVEAIKLLKEKGLRILIYSTRSDEYLKKYCDRFSIPVDYINRNPNKEGGNPGKPIAYVYVDDRSICYKGENAEQLVSEIMTFKTYWKKS